MSQSADIEFDRTACWDQDEPPASADAPASTAATATDWRGTAAVIGLSVAGALAPIGVALVATTNALLGPPLAASALVALLVLAPTGAGLATMLVGLRRVAALAPQAGGEAEHAVLRIFVATLLFGYVLGLAAIVPRDGAAAGCLPVAACELVVGWTLLLCVILWPAAVPLRRHAAMLFDILLFSAFLHLGGRLVAGWYPLYVVAIFYSGLRFGRGALRATAVTATLGFAAVVLSTEVWRQQLVLAAGLVAALVVFPAILAGAIREMATGRIAAARAEAERERTLLAIAAALRPAANPSGATPIDDILDFAALETGTFAAPLESFDLRGLVAQSLAPLRAKAAERGMALRWRVDPRLPCRLRGHAQAVARILRGLAEHAIDAAQAATVRIAVDGAASDARRLRLDLRVDGFGVSGEPGAPRPLTWRLVERLAALAGGSLAIERLPGQRVRLAVALPLAVEAGVSAPVLDLDRRPVLMVTEDDELAHSLAAPLATWNAEPRWPSDADQTLGELARAGEAKRAIVIIDGRDKLLSALGIAHQAARLGSDAPFVLLIAEEAQIGSLIAVDEGELDGLIPAPATERLLANALYALPLGPDRPKSHLDDSPCPPDERRVAAADAAPCDAGRITSIAAHRKFAHETAAALDLRAIEGLRALGGGAVFLGEVIDTFRIDARRIMQRIEEAVAAADTVRFGNGLIALRRAAGHLGGMQLCELTASLQRLTPGELRRQGAVHVHRLDAEIDRLTDAVTEFMSAEERRT